MDSAVGTSIAVARPGAMSLLDKYAAINSSIEDTRRRVSEVRSKLEQCNLKIQNLLEERNGMDTEIEQAKQDKLRLLTEQQEAEVIHQTKLMEKDRVLSEQRLAKSEFEKMRRFIEDERMEFLERCREFRSSCKRLRIASSILVLEIGTGAGLNENDTPDEGDLWRRLQEEDFSGKCTSEKDANDLVIELAEINDKETRKKLIEIEAALHVERMKYDDVIKRSNARNQRLTQQRAQLQRHRKEVEDLEREIHAVTDSIEEENQLAQTYEKECTRKKHFYESNVNASNKDALFNNHRTPSTLPSSGHQQRARGGVVTNPYNKQSSRTPTSNALNPRTNNSDSNMQSGKGGNIVLPYASNMTHGITPEFHKGQRAREMTTQQHPHRGGYARNQRQFGTSVGITIDSDVSNESQTMSTSATTSFYQSSSKTSTNYSNMANTEDSASDISSTSSDEEILSFNVFGKK